MTAPANKRHIRRYPDGIVPRGIFFSQTITICMYMDGIDK